MYEEITAPKRSIKGRVALLNGATTTNIDYDNDLIEIKVDRIGENGKFFGFGVAQKAIIKVKDKNREKQINQGQSFTIYFSTTDKNNMGLFSPIFYIDDVKRNENNNDLTITAYDGINTLNNLMVNDLISGDFYIDTLFNAILTRVGVIGSNLDINTLKSKYPEVANLNGNETARAILDDIAEVAGAIYYIDNNNQLIFRSITDIPEYTIDKSNYFTLETKQTYTLATITHITELGDNLTSSKEGISGITQYIRENCFLNNNSNAAVRIDEIIAVLGGATITEFICSWRGNFTTELITRIKAQTKDNGVISTILCNDSYIYNGGLKQTTNWSYEAQEETRANPTNLGDAIKETYARVDKVNKQIDLVVSEAEANSKVIAAIQLNTDSITGTVTAVEEATKTNNEAVNKELAELESKIEQTATELTIEINNRLTAVDSVTTSTGFTFDSNGLTIEKSGSEMKTTITDDGMKVYRDNTEMLTANNQGVNAVNLHATTYLIIGNNSRFEDYKSNRTGCFWIGG